MHSPTEQALKAFDAFLAKWIPPAMHEHMFGHSSNAAEIVRRAIRSISDLATLPLDDNSIGYAAFAQQPILGRDGSFKYAIESAVFPAIDQAAHAHDYCIANRRERGIVYVIGEIRKLD